MQPKRNRLPKRFIVCNIAEVILKKYVCILLAMVLVIGTSLLCCACNKDDNVIRLTEVTHSLFYTPQYVAMSLGYFEDEGLTVELSNGSGADNVMTALLTKEADMGLMGCEANVYVYLQGKKDYPKVVGQLTKRDGSFLLSREKDGFDYKNIKGKTVLMGRKGGMPAMILQYVLEKNGLVAGRDYTADYSIQFGALAPAFTGGTGDFVPLFEPTASQMELENKGYIVSSIGMDSGEIPYTCYTATDEFLKNNKEKTTAFLRAVWRGTEFALSHTPEEVAQAVALHFDGTPTELLVKSIANYQKCDVWTTTPVLNKDAYTRLLDVMENAGELQKRVDYDIITDNDCALEVEKSLK